MTGRRCTSIKLNSYLKVRGVEPGKGDLPIARREPLPPAAIILPSFLPTPHQESYSDTVVSLEITQEAIDAGTLFSRNEVELYALCP